MPEKLIVETCSPVLAGIKTANLFNCPYETSEQLLDDVADLNARFACKGIRMMVLGKIKEGRALIYVFRPSRLSEDLKNPETRSILKKCGYHTDNMGQALTTLITRFHEGNEFPHEIGCFLGYPAEDVIGFMEKRPCKIYGVWKVYGNVEEAVKLFQKYDACTKSYCRAFEAGVPVERLANREVL